MGPQSQKVVDPESLRQRCRRRECLDAFFTFSIIFLLVALTTVTVCGGMVLMELKKSNGTVSESWHQDPSRQTYKTENFVYLATTSSDLTHDFTMQLKEISFGEGTSVGSIFDFNQDRHSLTLNQEGNYFMYVLINATCTMDHCDGGDLSAKVGEKLTCEVKLPSTNKRFVTRQCWTVTLMPKHALIAQVNVPKGGLQHWKLDASSGIGMFRIN
ncbi:unnamed protein product [Ophioblennius macclurei]